VQPPSAGTKKYTCVSAKEIFATGNSAANLLQHLLFYFPPLYRSLFSLDYFETCNLVLNGDLSSLSQIWILCLTTKKERSKKIFWKERIFIFIDYCFISILPKMMNEAS